MFFEYCAPAPEMVIGVAALIPEIVTWFEVATLFLRAPVWSAKANAAGVVSAEPVVL